MWAFVALAHFALAPSAPGRTLRRGGRPAMLQALSNVQIARLSSATLAYLGDSVFETHARQRLLWPPLRHGDLVERVRSYSCAEGQSAALDRLLANGFALSAEEEAWMRRGRNSAGRGPKRAAPGEYRAASSLECLLGYLHLTNSTRCTEVLDFLIDAPDGA